MPISRWVGSNPPCDLLVVKLSALGDVVHALGAVSIIKRLTDLKVWWLVKESYFPLFKSVDFVDRVISPKDIDVTFIRRFPVVVDLQGLIKSAFYAYLLGKKRVGFSKQEAKEKLAIYFYSDVCNTSSRHVVQKLRELVCCACEIEDDGIYDFGLKVFKDEYEAVNSLVPEDYILVIPSAAWKTKVLSYEWCARFFALARKELELPVFFFLPGLGESKRYLQLGDALLPELDIRHAMAVIDKATVVVAPDTGFLHVAAALGKKCVGLYCPSDPERNGPFPSGKVVSCDCVFRGCFKRKCVSMCTDGIDPAHVVEKILDFE